MVKISKTYVPKETEKYMCAKHLAYFKLKLNEWKKDLKRSNNEAIAQASMDDNSASADIVDQASSYTEKNVEMRAINRQIKLITKIKGTKYSDATGNSPIENLINPYPAILSKIAANKTEPAVGAST